MTCQVMLEKKALMNSHDLNLPGLQIASFLITLSLINLISHTIIGKCKLGVDIFFKSFPT